MGAVKEPLVIWQGGGREEAGRRIDTWIFPRGEYKRGTEDYNI